MRIILILLASTVLVAGGVAASVGAVALGQSGEPTRTVTIEVGQQGPPGPPGPQGPPGAAADCPDLFSPALVVFNAPGGQQVIYTCLHD